MSAAARSVSDDASGEEKKKDSETKSSNLTLTLKSPVGKEAMIYNWPLKKGKGSVKRSEDKQDEAAEIIETIRWVCEDCQEIKQAMDSSGVLAASRYDPTSFESMNAICSTYNRSVDRLVSREKGTAKSERRWGRVARPHLKHILQKCYNKSVVDPNELNNYEAFTPEVYGETSFELICQVLDKLHPMKEEENNFVDLGSGVGQVVLQVAALTECKMSLGIEKAATPARYSEDMKKWFKFWMDFYGKIYSKFKLVTGDFLDKTYSKEIQASTIVFVNNFAFGPEVDQHLKDIFQDLNDGTRIFSSKSFCALNFRITDRNLTDIGTIMHVSKMDPLKGSVSWTGKPVSYFLHVIDRAKLERYFQKNAARLQKDEERRMRKGQRGLLSHTSFEHLMLNDASSSGSPEDSRASSVEKDTIDSSAATPSGGGGGGGKSKWSSAAQSGDEDTPPGSPKDGQRATRNKAKGATSLGGTTPLVVRKNRVGRPAKKRPESDFDDLINSNVGDPSSTAASATVGAGDTGASSNVTDSNSSTPPPSFGDSSNSSTTLSTRPIRAAVANAVAISEAASGSGEGGGAATGNGEKSQAKRRGRKPGMGFPTSKNLDLKKKKKKGLVARKLGKGAAIVAEKISGNKGQAASSGDGTPTISGPATGLDLLHKTMMDSINACAADVSAPQGCVNERLTSNAPKELVHEELPLSMNDGGGGTQLPFQLQLHLERCKRQYLSFMRHMQDPVFKAKVEADIDKERKRNHDLVQREKQLKTQIENLINDSLQLLKCRLNELGIQAKSTPEFIETANGILGSHHTLQKDKTSIEKEIQALEEETSRIRTSKEKELFETMVKTGVTEREARSIVRKHIDSTMNGLAAHVSGAKLPPSEQQRVMPLLNKLSDVTLTKCPEQQLQGTAQLPPSTQIRKRQARDKQKDWPEKRHKTGKEPFGLNAGDPKIKMEDKKIIEVKPPMTVSNPSDLIKRTSSSSLSITPSGPPQPPVEVRKLEPPSSQPPSNQPPSRQAVSVASQPPIPPMPRASTSAASINPGLPKIDIAAALNNHRDMQMAPQVAPPSLPPAPGPSGNELVLPPHPDSHSRSSEGAEPDKAYAKGLASSAPRAEQFEDRLKTIIHSVLTGPPGDNPKENKHHHPLHVTSPPVGMPPGMPSGGSGSKPMFSPVKKELPTNLPLPPSGVGVETSGLHRGPPNKGPDMFHPASMQPDIKPDIKQRPVMPYGPPFGSHRPPPDGMPPQDMRIPADDFHSRMPPTSSSMAQPKAAHSTPSMSRLPPRSSPSSQQQPAPPPSSGMSRMSQVIEDSIRGHLEAAAAAAAKDGPPQPPPPSSRKRPNEFDENEAEQFRYHNRYGGAGSRRPPPTVGAIEPSPYEWGGPALPPEAHRAESREVRAAYLPGRGPPHPYGGGGGSVYPPPPPPPGMSHMMQHHQQVSPRKRLTLSPPPPPPPLPGMAGSSSNLPPKKQHFEQPTSADYSRRDQGYSSSSSSKYPVVDTTTSSSATISSTSKLTPPGPPPHKPSTLPQMSLNFPADFGGGGPRTSGGGTSGQERPAYTNNGVTIRMSTPSPPPPLASQHRSYYPKFHYNQRPRSPSPSSYQPH